jgi:hypothetical protein
MALILSACGGSQTPASVSDNPSDGNQEIAETAESEAPVAATEISGDAVAAPLVLKGLGNTPSNILNGGIAVEYDGYIYHTDRMMWGNIWRTPAGGGESELIQSGTFHDLNVSGGVIFAVGSVMDQDTGLNKDGIYRMNVDGSGLILVKEGYFEQLALNDDYLYFMDTMDCGLYRMKYDGGDVTFLLENVYSDFIIIDDALYVCAELGGTYDMNVYKLPLDGSAEPEAVIFGIFGGGIDAVGKSIYFEGGNNTSNTYRYDTVTGETDIFLPKWISQMNTDGENIYYYWNGVRMDNADCGLYRINPDGSGEQLVMQAETFFGLNIAGGKMFWHNNDEQRRLTMMNLDATDIAFVEQAPD